MSDIMDIENLHIVGNDIIKETLAESTIGYEIDLGNGAFLAHGMRHGERIVILGNPAGTFGAVYYNDREACDD
jgi:hypothetical protein